MSKILKTIVKPFIAICDAQDNRWWTKQGYFYSFLARGTDCRCCLGMRIFVALMFGFVTGLIAIANIYLSVGIALGGAAALLVVFSILTMIEIETEEDNGETNT